MPLSHFEHSSQQRHGRVFCNFVITAAVSVSYSSNNTTLPAATVDSDLFTGFLVATIYSSAAKGCPVKKVAQSIGLINCNIIATTNIPLSICSGRQASASLVQTSGCRQDIQVYGDDHAVRCEKSTEMKYMVCDQQWLVGAKGVGGEEEDWFCFDLGNGLSSYLCSWSIAFLM
jgi:hypothetical protein